LKISGLKRLWRFVIKKCLYAFNEILSEKLLAPSFLWAVQADFKAPLGPHIFYIFELRHNNHRASENHEKYNRLFFMKKNRAPLWKNDRKIIQNFPLRGLKCSHKIIYIVGG
jgi:hypothetical protein